MKRNQNIGAFRGFTALEMVIAAALFVLVIGGLITVIISYYTVYNSQQALVNVSNSARAVMSAVESAGLQADHIVDSHAFSGTTYTTGTSAVVFELPAVNSSGDIVSGSYDYIAIVASGANVHSYTDAASGSARVSGSNMLSDSLSSLTFTYDNADMTQATKVDADIQTQQQVKQQTFGEHLHQQVYLRNI